MGIRSFAYLGLKCCKRFECKRIFPLAVIRSIRDCNIFPVRPLQGPSKNAVREYKIEKSELLDGPAPRPVCGARCWVPLRVALCATVPALPGLSSGNCACL